MFVYSLNTRGVRVRVRVKIRKDWKLIERGRVDVMSMEW